MIKSIIIVINLITIAIAMIFGAILLGLSLLAIIETIIEKFNK